MCWRWCQEHRTPLSVVLWCRFLKAVRGWVFSLDGYPVSSSAIGCSRWHCVSGFHLNDPHTRVISYPSAHTLYVCLAWSGVWKHVDRRWGEMYVYSVRYCNSDCFVFGLCEYKGLWAFRTLIVCIGDLSKHGVIDVFIASWLCFTVILLILT